MPIFPLKIFSAVFFAFCLTYFLSKSILFVLATLDVFEMLPSFFNITGMTSLLVSILLSRCFIILKSVLTIPIGFSLLKKAFSFFASSLVRKGESIW